MTSASAGAAFDVGIVTANEQGMRDFYETVLGCHHVATIPIGENRLVKLRLGESHLKLYVPAVELPAVDRAGAWPDRAGIRYFTVLVEDICSLVERCRVHGAPVTTEIVELPGGRFAAFIQDPDGNAIELFQDTGKADR